MMKTQSKSGALTAVSDCDRVPEQLVGVSDTGASSIVHVCLTVLISASGVSCLCDSVYHRRHPW